MVPLEALAERPDPAPAVEETAGLRLEMARVSRVLRMLNTERAEAIALHYFAGLSLAEVGRAMGKNEEAAKKLIQRGLAEMRDRLQASGQGAGGGSFPVLDRRRMNE